MTLWGDRKQHSQHWFWGVDFHVLRFELLLSSLARVCDSRALYPPRCPSRDAAWGESFAAVLWHLSTFPSPAWSCQWEIAEVALRRIHQGDPSISCQAKQTLPCPVLNHTSLQIHSSFPSTARAPPSGKVLGVRKRGVGGEWN